MNTTLTLITTTKRKWPTVIPKEGNDGVRVQVVNCSQEVTNEGVSVGGGCIVSLPDVPAISTTTVGSDKMYNQADKWRHKIMLG